LLEVDRLWKKQRSLLEKKISNKAKFAHRVVNLRDGFVVIEQLLR
jgi:hypothetical protein